MRTAKCLMIWRKDNITHSDMGRTVVCIWLKYQATAGEQFTINLKENYRRGTTSHRIVIWLINHHHTTVMITKSAATTNKVVQLNLTVLLWTTTRQTTHPSCLRVWLCLSGWRSDNFIIVKEALFFSLKKYTYDLVFMYSCFHVGDVKHAVCGGYEWCMLSILINTDIQSVWLFLFNNWLDVLRSVPTLIILPGFNI